MTLRVHADAVIAALSERVIELEDALITERARRIDAEQQRDAALASLAATPDVSTAVDEPSATIGADGK